MHRAGVGRGRGRLGGEQLHAALGTAPGFVAGDLGMHRAGVGDRPRAGRHGGRVVHLGDQGQDLVRRGGQPAVQLLGARPPAPAPAAAPRTPPPPATAPPAPRPRPRWPAGRSGRGCGAPGPARPAGRPARRPPPAPRAPAPPLDELLVLDPAAVPADQLHPRPGHGQVEHPGVGGVGQPQPHHLPHPRLQAEIRVAAGQEDVAEAAHGRIAGLGRAERGDPALLHQQVIDGEDEIAVGRRPVVGLGGDDQDVAVQAQLLGVVLPDVGVVPVQARHRGTGSGR